MCVFIYIGGGQGTYGQHFSKLIIMQNKNFTLYLKAGQKIFIFQFVRRFFCQFKILTLMDTSQKTLLYF
jgi:NADH:ubiquinone oxidoreductase subunit H